MLGEKGPRPPWGSERRMQRVFVGDVQGCADELGELLRRARAELGSRFDLWLVGDLINRGPGSLRVLRRVRDLVEDGRARCVLGNHELGLLRVAMGLEELGPRDTYGEVLAAPDRDDWIAWLRHRPLVESGRQGSQPFALVHAATHPDWDLAELTRRARSAEARLRVPDRREFARFLAGPREPDSDRDVLERLTHCRSVDAHGAWLEAPPELAPAGYEAWHRRFARRVPDFGVVYGHWAMQGLHVAPWLRGLDTGCVHHGRGRDGCLTAWLPGETETPFDVPDDRFWRIPARRVYYAASDSRGDGEESMRR